MEPRAKQMCARDDVCVTAMVRWPTLIECDEERRSQLIRSAVDGGGRVVAK